MTADESREEKKRLRLRGQINTAENAILRSDRRFSRGGFRMATVGEALCLRLSTADLERLVAALEAKVAALSA